MGSDCTIAIDNGVLNVRVGAIIIKDGKFLMMSNPEAEYYYSVGGRIQFGESAEEAVVREVLEETGVKMEVDRLGFVHENFFYGDEGLKTNREVYEIAFLFYMKMPEKFEPNGESYTTEEKRKEELVWVDMKDEKAKYYPKFLGKELQNPCSGVRHIVTDDRKKK